MTAQQAGIVPDEVLTGEAVALDVQPLGFFLRAAGTLVDVLIGIALAITLVTMAGWAALPDAIGPGPVTVGVIVAVTVVLPVAVETLSRGRSVGRLIVGGRIVRADGGAAGLRQALVRALAGVLEIWMTLGAIAALTGAFTPRSQRLGDLMAGTYCQRTRTPVRPGVPAPMPDALAGWAQVADVSRLPDPLARRCAQFTVQAERMEPAARARAAASLAAELTPFVAPLPRTDAETLVRGAVAARREREYRALMLQRGRVAALIPPR